jgi:TrmH family RNA methyltransferase
VISKANIQYVRGLQDKKQRQKYGHFVVEGEKSITELLKSHFEIISLYALKEWIDDNLKIIKKIKPEIITVSELKQMSVHQTPQQVLAVVKIPVSGKLDKKGKFILALDSIQDPGNLGTIIRIADWYGIGQVVCNKGCADVYNPKCINSTMGSFLRVEIVYKEIDEAASEAGLPLVVAALDGEDVHSSRISKGMIVIGNEGHGVHKDIMKAAKYKVTIPRVGGAESLNAAISTAVIVDNLLRESGQ